jgi:hypothetical protein
VKAFSQHLDFNIIFMQNFVNYFQELGFSKKEAEIYMNLYQL